MSKICSKCKNLLPYDKFQKDLRYDGGCKGVCKLCLKAYNKSYRVSNAERAKKWFENRKLKAPNASKEQYIKHRDKVLSRHKQYYLKNKSKVTVKHKLWRQNNKERHDILRLCWKKKNKIAIKAATAKRRAKLLERLPAWADLEGIEFFYLACPKGYTVDHIIPLQGKNVSGFHILENLQYLTFFENLSKGNKF